MIAARQCNQCGISFVSRQHVQLYCSRHCAGVAVRSREAIAPARRFIRKILITDSCWLWRGPLHVGYGQFHPTRTRPVPAHRYAYETFIGPIPEGLQIDHLCRVRSCVRPDHLEAVTQYENNLRSTSPVAINARKVRCPKGHAYDVARADGARGCLRCRAEASRRYYARIRASA